MFLAYRHCFFFLLAVLLLLPGCGGGGGGQKNAITLVDPAPSYTGVKTAASVTAANAEDLAMGAFYGAEVGSAIGAARKVEGKAPASLDTAPKLQLVARVVKKSLRGMDLPQLAKQRAGDLRSKRTTKGAARAVTYQITGEQGGTASFNFDLNDADGTFSGSVLFSSFASGGIAMSGNCDLLGALDPGRQEFSRLTLSFKELLVDMGQDDFTLVGSLSWGFNPAASSDTLAMNVVLLDAPGKTYWFKDYQVSYVYSSGYVSNTISGRYYDADNGYVDVATTAPMVVTYGDSWPSQGEMTFAGDQGGQVRLDFQAETLTLEADLDRNGQVDWQSQRQTNTVQVPGTNYPPVADAGADRSVAQGTDVLLDGSASYDVNGDSLYYYWSFVSCPNNSCPSLTGSNSATPSFVAERDGQYLLRLTVYDDEWAQSSDTVTVTSATLQTDPALLERQWLYSVYGTSIGEAGLLASDLNGDGIREVVASASAGGFGENVFWYVMQRTADGEYSQTWRSPIYSATIVRMLLADMTGDGKDDVVVGMADGTIYIHNGTALDEVTTLRTANSLYAMALGDLEGDGSTELIIGNGTGIYVYSAQSGALKWSVSGSGDSIAVGNVDADPALEIVSTTFGGKGYVIDGVTKATTWEYANGFGAKIALADLDGDGMQEIVAASSWYKITMFDADRKTPVWEITTSLDIGAILVADSDGDGGLEIIYGDSQWGKVHAVDALTHFQKWAVSNPDHGVSGVAVADVDNDGTKELLWGAGGSSTGADHLYVADPATGTVEWKSVHIDGPLSAVALGDVDDDGADEILMVSFESDSGYGEGVIHIFDARTHALEYRAKLGVTDWMGVRSVEIGDVDGDGKTEFVVTTANIYDGVIRVYDGSTRVLKKESAGYDGNYFSALAIGDVDGDGKTEIVAGQGREHTGAAGTYLVVLDGATLQEKWRSVDVGNYWGEIYDLRLADLDGDGRQDIVATLAGSRLIVYDGVTHDLKLLAEHASRAVEVGDIDGDGYNDLLVGRTDGKIDVHDGRNFAWKKTVPTSNIAALDALKLADLDGDGAAEWILAAGGMMTVLDGNGQGVKWKSGDLGGSLGLYNHIAVRDGDGDGKKEISIGSALALYQFE